MIDVHCHLLPGIDDGARDLQMALKMAGIARDDGITDVVCTPHIYPGMYENDAPGIRAAVASLQTHLDAAGIDLRLAVGADAHLVPELGAGIETGRVPTLAGSRYLLLEPPHHVAPPRFEETVFELMASGLVPVITHPERLTWVETHHEVFVRLAERGCWMQVTAGALTGRFGPRVSYWADRFVCEGRAHILATDAHHPTRRPPLLREARAAAEKLVGAEQATHMVLTRPAMILADQAPESAPAMLAKARGKAFGWLSNWLP